MDNNDHISIEIEKCSTSFKNKKTPEGVVLLVGRDGFEPSKTESTDLQSVAFGRSATFPKKWSW